MTEGNPHPPTGKEKYSGLCSCGHTFGSNRPIGHGPNKKRFGSQACYFASPEFQKNIERAHEGSRARANVVLCSNCNQEFKRARSQSEGRNFVFCNKHCKREWMANRFDRFVASCPTLTIPQCYDEFLSQAELPCVVDGCDWKGKCLGTHLNIVHGVSASDAKKQLGFNEGTGLVSLQHARYMREVGIENVRGRQMFKSQPDGCHNQKKRRPEAIEHMKKSAAIRALNRVGDNT